VRQLAKNPHITHSPLRGGLGVIPDSIKLVCGTIFLQKLPSIRPPGNCVLTDEWA